MARSIGLGGFIGALLLGGFAFADILSMKDGSVIECKIVKESVIKNNKQYLLIEDEKKQQKEVALDDVAALYRSKPSWEVRAENLAWYEKEKGKERGTWSKEFTFAKDCKRRALDDQASSHFKKAYELRKPEIADAAAREKFARWLEKDCGLFEEAQAEYLLVFEEKKKTVGDKAADHYNLGKWCEGRNLYAEADAEYTQAIQLDAKFAAAQKGLERLKQLRETLVNPNLFRTVREQMDDGVGFYASKIAGDGSYGSEVSEAGIQGLRAMTALCGLGLIAKWEFSAVDNPELAQTMPKELDRALQFVLGHPEEKKALRGPDVWGGIYSIEFLAKLLNKDAARGQKEKIKSKLEACIGGLIRMQTQEGGWAYYNHNMTRPNSFLTAPAVIALVLAKREGVQVPDDVIARGAKSIQSQKQGDGIFMYKGGARQSIEGSCGRSPACELALLMAGTGSVQQVQVTVDNFFKYRHILEKIKQKKGTHIGSGATAPYYFLFGHFYCARAIKALDKSAQPNYLTKLRDLMIGCQESDNSWWDTPLEKDSKIYGTAFGVLTLYHIATVRGDMDGAKPRK